MADFILVLPAFHDRDNQPNLLNTVEISAASPVTFGEMTGNGSWLVVPEHVCRGGRMIVWGNPEAVAEAIAADGRVASIVPVDHE